ncbi:uncharacterized protein LOC119317703 isoform X2 [Triticum dicoccoides]|uniref:uncharacterized protein LOC119317703 isoform X2 n=1 Tax=Triticum dicoccoides TaxID=85692 RepID=UPI001891DD84|nr:uncharacterized protein LOC119317703 isoform X2 [Triticum dicoccoides]
MCSQAPKSLDLDLDLDPSPVPRSLDLDPESQPCPGVTTTAELPDEAENPCLSRFRHRRLLAFLSRQRYDVAFNGLMLQASEPFCLERLQGLVRKGLWEDAIDYLDGFLPAGPRSLHAHAFRNFLLMHHYLASIAAGDESAMDKLRAHHWMQHVVDAWKTKANHTFPRVMAQALLSSEQLRASMDWDGVRREAAYILSRLASRTPELNRPLTLPTCYTKPHQVLPIDVASGRRRVKEQRPHLQPAAVARAILFRGSQRYTRSLANSSFEFIENAKEWFATIMDESLRAGSGKATSLLQQIMKEGAPVAPVSLTSPAKSSGTSSLTNAEITKLCIKGLYAPLLLILDGLGAPVSSVCQTLNMTRDAENYGISSVTSPGPEKSQEGACGGFNPRKNPRAELATIDEYLDSKRQRTTGTFGEASMVPVNEVWAEAH